ncbi:Calcineurin-like phosphoesterase [Phytophthora palmivora]|uniref:Calcineurin-like phosphoesterase n=1 Tax=Phytophthora palmivora TaxID=4796 RepID=A0A2P4XT13_9STRA|nr:Calcineurin-like phosphoesterase [Phytophthora palmivora]
MVNYRMLTSGAVILALMGISSCATVTLGLTATLTSDPASAQYTLSAFATGDWGATTYKGSCCGSKYNNYDLNAQEVVATLMNIEAGTSMKPNVFLGHGDSFYWNGINGLAERDARFAASFEAKYDGDNIKNVPWVNVMGNHDYGGSDYICISGEKMVPCNSTEELFQGLANKLKWQADYTSPNDDRWHMDDHFYVYRVEDPASGVSIDIFNVETNDADIHGADLICCQCYGYAKADNSGCNTVTRDDKYCFGGNTNMFDTCVAKFAEWGNDSRTQLLEQVKRSTATWKIVNSHFSPYDHFREAGMNKWFDVLRQSGVRVFLHGHTHAEKHDYSESLGVHFVENGAGGGRQKGVASTIQPYAAKYVKNEWAYTADEYGFISLQASKEWLKLQYHTTDNKWNFTENFADTTIGGVATKHCWYIPADGSEGKAC